MTATSPEELLRLGSPDEALAALQQHVRERPAEPKLRVFLFQLLSVLGQWERAMNQLNVAAELDPGTLLMAQACRHALNAEALREEIFAGARLPLVFGEPAEWVGWIVRANQAAATGSTDEAERLREKALAEAPAVAGSIDGHPFQWLADADPRMGPVLEAVIGGKYFWVPLYQVRQINIQKPTDLRDLVWTAADFIWANGGDAVGLIPTRYPGSESSKDGGIRMARKTEWMATPAGEVPMGQRMFVTDEGEYPLLETRRILLGEQVAPATATASAADQSDQPGGTPHG